MTNIEASEGSGFDYLRPSTRTTRNYDERFAHALASKARYLGIEGRYREALAPSPEAADLLRNLARIKPVVHTSDLAVVLRNLARALRHLDEEEEALRLDVEAVQWWATLAELHPQFTPQYDAAWNTLARTVAEGSRRR